MSDLIDRQAALKELAVCIHLIDKTLGKGTLTDDDCMKAAKSVLGEDAIPAVQPEIVRCKDCKHWDTEWSVSESGAHYCPMVDGNRNSDFYCADAERRTDG